MVGHGHGMRVECRAPGGDVNQYLAVAALIAGGLHGIEQELELPDRCAGNAYTSGAQRLPTTLAEAAELFDGSAVARAAFGDEVVDALPQQRAGRADGVQRRRHRLGEGAWL